MNFNYKFYISEHILDLPEYPVPSNIELYPKLNLLIDQDALYEWTSPYQLNQYRQFLGPYGEINIAFSDDIDRTKKLDHLAFYFRNNGFNAVPSDDQGNADNYRYRTLKISDLEYRAAYTHPSGAPWAIACIINFEDSIIKYILMHGSYVYNFTEYEYMVDIRKFHGACYYDIWGYDGDNGRIFHHSKFTQYPAQEENENDLQYFARVALFHILQVNFLQNPHN